MRSVVNISSTTQRNSMTSLIECFDLQTPFQDIIPFLEKTLYLHLQINMKCQSTFRQLYRIR